MGKIGRRALLAGLSTAGVRPAGVAVRAHAFAPPPGVIVPRPLDLGPFAAALSALTPRRRHQLGRWLFDADLATLRRHLDVGRLTAADLVLYAVDRIARFDVETLRAVVDLNPDAVAIAAELDAELAAGRRRGPLHGIPVLLKDNIATGDRMRTTAGAAALRYARADRDARLVAALRRAGAIVLGKTNLSEWSYWMSTVAPSGYSAVGGQTASPFGAGIDPWGSSTGSAVAVAANLGPVAVGTETLGSIVSPAARASLVGVRPTAGLVSRDRIIPIADDLDTAGPLTRTVADAAALLTALAGDRDPADRLAADAAGLHGTDFVAALDAGGLRGARIGVVGVLDEAAGPPILDDTVVGSFGLRAAVAAMEAAGATAVGVRVPPLVLEGPGFERQFNSSMRRGVDAYLAATNAPMRSLAEVIAFNDVDPARYAPWGQDRLLACQWDPLSFGEARALGRSNREQARRWLDALIDGWGLDALVCVDSQLSLVYPFANVPAVAVPAGRTPWGTPFAVTFVGRTGGDAGLLTLAHAFEQAFPRRVVPRLG